MSDESPENEAQGPVIVGYDGREESERALEYALEEAASRETSVIVVVGVLGKLRPAFRD